MVEKPKGYRLVCWYQQSEEEWALVVEGESEEEWALVVEGESEGEELVGV